MKYLFPNTSCRVVCKTFEHCGLTNGVLAASFYNCLHLEIHPVRNWCKWQKVRTSITEVTGLHPIEA